MIISTVSPPLIGSSLLRKLLALLISSVSVKPRRVWGFSELNIKGGSKRTDGRPEAHYWDGGAQAEVENGRGPQVRIPHFCPFHDDDDLRVPSSRAHLRHLGWDRYRKPYRCAVICRFPLFGTDERTPSSEQLRLVYPAGSERSSRILGSTHGAAQSYADSIRKSTGRISRILASEWLSQGTTGSRS